MDSEKLSPLYLVVGRTSSGKDHLVKQLCKHYFKRQLVSYTDRPIRDGEKNNREHIFITKEEMDNLLSNDDMILAKTQIGEYRYCATVSQIRDDKYVMFYIIDPEGVYNLEVRHNDINRDIHIIYVDGGTKAQHKARFIFRGGNKSDFEERWKAENIQFTFFEKTALKNMSSYIIVNNICNDDQAFKEAVQFITTNKLNEKEDSKMTNKKASAVKATTSKKTTTKKATSSKKTVSKKVDKTEELNKELQDKDAEIAKLKAQLAAANKKKRNLLLL